MAKAKFTKAILREWIGSHWHQQSNNFRRWKLQFSVLEATFAEDHDNTFSKEHHDYVEDFVKNNFASRWPLFMSSHIKILEFFPSKIPIRSLELTFVEKV